MTADLPRTLYKWLGEYGEPHNGGNGNWALPHGKRPGRWMPPISGLIPCVRGYHLCRVQDLLTWCAPALWVAEWRGEITVADDKIVVAEARLLSRVETWTERTARLFACDCAERALAVWARRGTVDPRSQAAVEVARRYADGGATTKELAAAWDAAWSAAWDAARDAARDAAWSAARSAARDAAWDAARDAAWSAAWSAAWDAARDAARDAAWDAERQWQTRHLCEMLGIEVTP